MKGLILTVLLICAVSVSLLGFIMAAVWGQMAREEPDNGMPQASTAAGRASALIFTLQSDAWAGVGAVIMVWWA